MERLSAEEIEIPFVKLDKYKSTKKTNKMKIIV